MNKVVCSICGTSYPENVSECPICGYTRSSDTSRENGENSYTHVPGGRFSKTNVRKRNKTGSKKPAKSSSAAKPAAKKEEKTSAGLVIVVILLLLAIITVVGYIALRFFLPNEYIFEGLDQISISSIFQRDETIPEEEVPELPEETEPEADTLPEYEPILCQSISVDQVQINCDSLGATYQITYELTPVDTEEEVFFYSSDDAVASVDEFGLITVNGEGTATITVNCGSASTQFEVSCVLPTEAPTEETVVLTLNRKEITFTTQGESWLLYDGTIAVEDILWTSDDNKVATIEGGKVVAVANGDTTVYAVYEGQTVSCAIHCKFDEEEATETTGKVSEADGSKENRTYKLYNPHGRADDVTIKVGREFKLRLVDQYKNTAEGVQWSVEDPKICSYEDGVVKALAAGTTKVIATYNGNTYSCIVRVNKK